MRGAVWWAAVSIAAMSLVAFFALEALGRSDAAVACVPVTFAAAAIVAVRCYGAKRIAASLLVVTGAVVAVGFALHASGVPAWLSSAVVIGASVGLSGRIDHVLDRVGR